MEKGREMKPAQIAEEMVDKEWGEVRDKDKVVARGRAEGKAEEVGRVDVKQLRSLVT